MKRFGKGCLVVVGVFLLLGIIGAVLGGGSNQQNSSTASAPTAASNSMQAAVDASTTAPVVQPTAAPEATAAPVAAGVGQDVQVDEVRWNVLEAADVGQTLKSDNEFIKELKTSGRFIRVRLEIENLSKDMLSFTGIDLQDDQGRTFKRSSDALLHVPSEEQCLLENLNPNVVKSCTIIYEVPQNAARLQALVGDLKLFGGESTLIDLGLE